MKSLDFPKANIAIAKDQPEYQTLYAHVDINDITKPATVCFELTEEEISEIVRTKKIWFTQVTFGRGYSPIRMSFMNPYTPEESDTSYPPMEDNRTPSDLWDATHYLDSHTSVVHTDAGPCMNCGASYEDHFYTTRQCRV